MRAELWHFMAHLLDGWCVSGLRISLAEDAMSCLRRSFTSQGLVSLSKS